ncbi:MAG TPA: OmpA family protein [Gammaproteobacteria bacterium]
MKFTRLHSHFMALIAVTALLAGCGTSTQISRETILQQNSAIANLERNLRSAEQKGVNYLAPEGFNASLKLLEESVDNAKDQRSDAATHIAGQGSVRLQQAEKDAATSRYILEEVLTIRDRAAKAGALSSYPKEFSELEESLRETTNMIERNKLDNAKKQRAELIKAYSQLELKALKEDTAQSARDALERARKVKADDFAPKTFKLATDELQMAQSVLEADRRSRDKANAHARRAIELAEQSIQIAEIQKDFDRRDFTQEDIVLWYQKQLESINEPLNTPISFAKPNREIVTDMRNTIAALVASKDETSKQLQASEAKMTTTAQQRQEIEKREREMQQRFETVQSLFTEAEANVYRQRQNVLLSVHGFYFPSGKTIIEARNFTLLNKINRAIEQFPNSTIVVSGHTDSVGDEKINLSLSEGRASNVAKFLIETSGINAKRIRVQGFGESKPVASNENADGRSLNRRVEVLIINN